MLTRFHYIKCLNKSLLIKVRRYLSISKFDLIESSRNIQQILKTADDYSSSNNNDISKWLYNSLDKIHLEYPSSPIATSTKEIYQINSSKLNSTFVKLENDRKKEIDGFKNKEKELIILLRYIRYIKIAFIYRLITLDINNSIKECLNSIINLTENKNNLNQNSTTLISELTFFVNFLSSVNSLSHVKSLLSRTYIVNYLSNNLFSILSQNSSILLVNELCLSLHSIYKIPSSIEFWPYALLKYLYDEKCCSLIIIKYLILIQHSCFDQTSSKLIFLLNKYLTQIGIYQEDLNIICQLLILISAFNYSHEEFHRNILEKIKKCKDNKENIFEDIKLVSRFIYYLCLNDPTNRFQSRPIIVELSKKLNENLNKEIKFPQWIVQAQHGMMFANIYNYQLSFSTLQDKVFPLLFREMGVYTLSIQRQLFDIHYALSIDRPSLKTPLLNSEILSFTTKISDEYRSSIRPNQKSYNRLLIELKDLLNNIYGDNTCKIIDTDLKYPYILFDFLEVNLPDTDQLRSIGINTEQRIAILPILNSMLIRQQRSDGSLVRVFSANTTMRYRLIEKQNYQVLPIFHGEYLHALRNNTIKNLFETNLALKSLPKQFSFDS